MFYPHIYQGLIYDFEMVMRVRASIHKNSISGGFSMTIGRCSVTPNPRILSLPIPGFSLPKDKQLTKCTPGITNITGYPVMSILRYGLGCGLGKIESGRK